MTAHSMEWHEPEKFTRAVRDRAALLGIGGRLEVRDERGRLVGGSWGRTFAEALALWERVHAMRRAAERGQ
jgi:hypothetical protein